MSLVNPRSLFRMCLLCYVQTGMRSISIYIYIFRNATSTNNHGVLLGITRVKALFQEGLGFDKAT